MSHAPSPESARDIAEVPAQVKRRLSFVYVDQMDEVFANAFCEALVISNS